LSSRRQPDNDVEVLEFGVTIDKEKVKMQALHSQEASQEAQCDLHLQQKAKGAMHVMPMDKKLAMETEIETENLAPGHSNTSAVTGQSTRWNLVMLITRHPLRPLRL
jgi:hypothetical protein